MSERVGIEAQRSVVPFELDSPCGAGEGRVSSKRPIFQLVGTPADGKRYELYSDGAFSQEEVR